MAHFAEIGTDNKVLQVIVVHNNELLDENGVEQESNGAAFCHNLFGGVWMQTSYNATFRKNFAGIGYTYRADIDAFVSPQPYPSWVLNNVTAQWEAPVPMPDNGDRYTWDENTLNWVQLETA
jgi:hypothetical protein